MPSCDRLVNANPFNLVHRYTGITCIAAIRAPRRMLTEMADVRRCFSLCDRYNAQYSTSIVASRELVLTMKGYAQG